MNLDELQSVQSRERQTDSLQQLRESFYEDAGAYIQELREDREAAAERATDPFDSPEVNRLSDDITTAEQTVEALYERRVGKVVKMASLAAADMPTEQEGLTREERDLFETLVAAIEDNRAHVLDVLAGDGPSGAVGTDPSERRSADASDGSDGSGQSDGVDAAEVMGGTEPSGGTDSRDRPADVPPDAPPEGNGDGDGSGDPGASAGAADSAGHDAVDRTTVRITDDVGEILGVDEREYDLSTDDVVTLPTANADPLVERDAAQRLD